MTAIAAPTNSRPTTTNGSLPVADAGSAAGAVVLVVVGAAVVVVVSGSVVVGGKVVVGAGVVGGRVDDGRAAVVVVRNVVDEGRIVVLVGRNGVVVVNCDEGVTGEVGVSVVDVPCATATPTGNPTRTPSNTASGQRRIRGRGRAVTGGRVRRAITLSIL
jgi:hypothetical protein